ncbi:MAG: ATP-dependent Clp protease proteolytic subunit [Pseudomonadota bacterium]|nr:ATP-dependent Clp protease proteolytic subunit [Pseudomonadota bacterium]
MFANEDKPGRLEGMVDAIPEGSVLRGLFAGLLTFTIILVGLDFSDLVQRDDDLTVLEQRTEPLEMERPKKDDNLRPYLPRTMPVAPGGGGRPSMPGFASPPSAKLLREGMEFRLGETGRASAVGLIKPGTGKAFERFLEQNREKLREIVLHSPGGSVPDALAMARAIRKAKLTTSVASNGYCASSCPLVFAGGEKRLAGDKAWIGVHRIYTLDSTVGTLQEGMAAAQDISARCQQFLIEMDVDPKVWIHAMTTPKERLYVFTPEELTKLKLATRVGPV